MLVHSMSSTSVSIANFSGVVGKLPTVCGAEVDATAAMEAGGGCGCVGGAAAVVE